ncbi:MAG: zinc ribbon domain-containing protein [Candidatus Latescibacteria bacterium]|nr:zinc ribbon domain-containing protein [Candidatus Latescibacterota bacterium]
MPTYEYECQRCEHQFEHFQSITAPPLTTCPQCSGPVVRLISSGAGFIFKGSGFYTTDYRSEHYKQREKSEKPPASPSTEAASKTDTAPPKPETSSPKPENP